MRSVLYYFQDHGKRVRHNHTIGILLRVHTVRVELDQTGNGYYLNNLKQAKYNFSRIIYNIEMESIFI